MILMRDKKYTEESVKYTKQTVEYGRKLMQAYKYSKL